MLISFYLKRRIIHSIFTYLPDSLITEPLCIDNGFLGLNRSRSTIILNEGSIVIASRSKFSHDAVKVNGKKNPKITHFRVSFLFFKVCRKILCLIDASSIKTSSHSKKRRQILLFHVVRRRRYK